MEGIRQLPIPGFRQTSLKKSFKLGLLPLLTTCSREEIAKAFGRFTDAEQDALHRLLIQVIPSLHQNIEDEFESQCLETQAGTVLDTVEELVEEQNLDSLSQYSDKTEVADAWQNLSIAKRNEIHYLTRLIKTAEEHTRVTRARVEQLKKEMQDSGAADVIEKVLVCNFFLMRTGILSYSTSDICYFHDPKLL
ncbi:uncharacterized protein LOC131308313 isoform X2 [Rhododendron vialii]|uniref:uncharacterized protein LOC131308313 isoform X2 n=1 Tax=Rhododendron vialii TaxID=182163 RepID=UPI00265E7A7C|nr:uncharacterized protein LOC131308313 isoform X2 [Rhododendron vialii]